MDTIVTRKKIGNKLRELRLKAGYSNYETLAYDTGLTRQTIGRAETGGNLTMDTFLIIIKFLKVSPEEFFKGIK